MGTDGRPLRSSLKGASSTPVPPPGHAVCAGASGSTSRATIVTIADEVAALREAGELRELSPSSARPRSPRCLGLYADAAARREKLREKQLDARKKDAEALEDTRRESWLKLRERQRTYRLQDTRSHEEREEDVLRRRSARARMNDMEKLAREQDELVDCTFKPKLVTDWQSKKGGSQCPPSYGMQGCVAGGTGAAPGEGSSPSAASSQGCGGLGRSASWAGGTPLGSGCSQKTPRAAPPLRLQALLEKQLGLTQKITELEADCRVQQQMLEAKRADLANRHGRGEAMGGWRPGQGGLVPDSGGSGSADVDSPAWASDVAVCSGVAFGQTGSGSPRDGLLQWSPAQSSVAPEQPSLAQSVVVPEQQAAEVRLYRRRLGLVHALERLDVQVLDLPAHDVETLLNLGFRLGLAETVRQMAPAPHAAALATGFSAPDSFESTSGLCAGASSREAGGAGRADEPFAMGGSPYEGGSVASPWGTTPAEQFASPIAPPSPLMPSSRNAYVASLANGASYRAGPNNRAEHGSVDRTGGGGRELDELQRYRARGHERCRHMGGAYAGGGDVADPSFFESTDARHITQLSPQDEEYAAFCPRPTAAAVAAAAEAAAAAADAVALRWASAPAPVPTTVYQDSPRLLDNTVMSDSTVRPRSGQRSGDTVDLADTPMLLRKSSMDDEAVAAIQAELRGERFAEAIAEHAQGRRSSTSHVEEYRAALARWAES